MPKASDDDGELTREEKKEEKKKHTAAKKHLAEAVKAFKKSEKTDADKRELEEVVTKYIRILTHEETKVARKLSDTYNRGGRRTRRRRSRRGTMRR
jgi:hypothetical protein